MIAIDAGEYVAPLEVLVIEVLGMHRSSEVAELVDDAVAPTAIDRLATVWARSGHEFVQRLCVWDCFGDDVIIDDFTNGVFALSPGDDARCGDADGF